MAATARQPEVLEGLVKQYGEQLWTGALDVTDTNAIRQVLAVAFNALGRIDVIVSNAGYGLFGAAEELSDTQIQRQIDTNLIGSIQLARAAIPHLRVQGGGRLIQLSSMGGHCGFPGLSLYHATKWGIEGFYESLIPEIAPFGIEATLVEPGGGRTDFGGRSMVLAEPIDAYTAGPVGHSRAIISGEVKLDPVTAASLVPGDPAKIAQAIIDSADVSPAPKRLFLGSDAYKTVTGALRERLSQLEAAKELAYSTDADDVVTTR